MSPEDKTVEERHQTQHKLELMERYWGAWCSILAQTAGKYPFCPSRLWLVDTHAGPGRHLSSTDPHGEIPGTPMLAALAARSAQRKFPGVEIKVRATDKHQAIATELNRRLGALQGEPPDGVDAKVAPVDWVEAVPWVTDEIASDDHPHGGRPGSVAHDHRSLWFVDPFGIEGIDHAVIREFPVGSEVIINFDLMATLRAVGKALKGDEHALRLLRTVYGGDGWRDAGVGPSSRQPLADIFAQSFPRTRWQIRKAHLLRPSGSQDRAMIHLTAAVRADEVFTADVRRALKAGTVIAGRILSKQEKDGAAKVLWGLFHGLTLTTREMSSSWAAWDLGQLRAICDAAADADYGTWDQKETMTWYEERQAKPGLFDDLPGDRS